MAGAFFMPFRRKETPCHHDRTHRAVTQAVLRWYPMDRSTATSTSHSTRRRCAAPVPVATTGHGKKARKAYLVAHPLCVKCLEEGRYVNATVVYHIVPHRGDPGLFWDRSNWRALCKRHHDEKTGSEDSNPTYHY